jgi:hypothetical protein
MCLWCCWKDLDEQEFGMIWMSRNLFGMIWIQNVADINFKVISAVENSNKFQKTKFWKEKSVEDVVILGPLGPTAQATLVRIILTFAR